MLPVSDEQFTSEVKCVLVWVYKISVLSCPKLTVTTINDSYWLLSTRMCHLSMNTISTSPLPSPACPSPVCLQSQAMFPPREIVVTSWREMLTGAGDSVTIASPVTLSSRGKVLVRLRLVLRPQRGGLATRNSRTLRLKICFPVPKARETDYNFQPKNRSFIRLMLRIAH
jgi:hypothetical protein